MGFNSTNTNIQILLLKSFSGFQVGFLRHWDQSSHVTDLSESIPRKRWAERVNGIGGRGRVEAKKAQYQVSPQMLIFCQLYREDENRAGHSWQSLPIEQGTLVHYWWEYKSVQPLWKTVQRQLKVLKIELSQDPAIPIPDVNSEKIKMLSQKDTCTLVFTELFTTVKIWKQAKCPLMDEWTKKPWFTHTRVLTWYYLAIQKRKLCHLVHRG